MKTRDQADALEAQRKDDAELQRQGYFTEPTVTELQQMELAYRDRRRAQLTAIQHRQAREELIAEREYTGEYLDRLMEEREIDHNGESERR